MKKGLQLYSLILDEAIFIVIGQNLINMKCLKTSAEIAEWG